MREKNPEFDARMFEIYRRAKDEAKYTASIFLRMLDDKGGIETAKFLINSPKPSEGYTKLYERNRLDLTVEAMVVSEPRWRKLFTDDEVKKAKARLKQYGYESP